MPPITHQIRIHAPPDAVWAVLTDLPSYGRWNRYSPSAQGELRVGGTVEIVARLGNGQQRVNNRVSEVILHQRLCWESLNWYRFLVFGVRCRELEPQPDHTTIFRETEVLHGLLAGVIQRFMGAAMGHGLKIECESLKEEVERRNGRSST
jgi:hypothetical protein